MRIILVKISIDSLFKGKELPPQKKRVLAIGGVAFIVLLFISFLLSLSEGDDKANQDNNNNAIEQNAQTNNGASGSLQLPSSQRYDFESSGQVVGGGLESLLNDAPITNNNIGVNNDPFANMNGQGTTHEDEQALGPAPIPTEDDYDNQDDAPQELIAPQAPQAPASSQTSLYCDSYSTSAGAESQKAVLAFQGISASVITNKDGTYGLKLGPFKDAQLARDTFNELANKGLLQRCALIKQ